MYFSRYTGKKGLRTLTSFQLHHWKSSYKLNKNFLQLSLSLPSFCCFICNSPLILLFDLNVLFFSFSIDRDRDLKFDIRNSNDCQNEGFVFSISNLNSQISRVKRRESSQYIRDSLIQKFFSLHLYRTYIERHIISFLFL